VPEFIDPVFAKTSPTRSFLVIENERYGLCFAETGSTNSGTGVYSFVTIIFTIKLCNLLIQKIISFAYL
jgi:hypothetical protein